ncbi:S66 peptidase family protein [Monashia sp. NPDC004114]
MSVSLPPRLAAGDRVAVVAPSGPTTLVDLDRGLEVLRSWGLDPVEGKHVRDRDDYLAGSDADRAEDLTWALTDPSIAGVLCSDGGYGVQRMIDLVDWAAVGRSAPKVLVGFSDITAAHAAHWARLGRIGLYGPMVACSAFFDERSAEHLRATLMEPETTTTIAFPEASPIVEGTAHGTIVGGCLSLLASNVGTVDAPQADGRIVLIEDVTEQPYRLDEFTTQLVRSGWLTGAAGIVLGSFSECGPLDRVREVMTDRLAPLGIPVLWGTDLGHCPSIHTLPLGVAATLDTASRTIVLDEAALR